MASDTAVTLGGTATTSRRRTWFHAYASALLLLVVIAGFAPTLFARGAFFDVPPIPLYLFAHGFILTGWFVWLVVQTSLVSSGRLATHRRAGRIGAIYAVFVVCGALMATLGVVRRFVAAGFDLDADISTLGEGGLGQGVSILNFAAFVVWGNLASLLAFAVLVAFAVALRRRPEAHKRLMLLASVAIIGPALARLSRWPVFGGELGSFISLATWSLFIAIAANDLWTRRRLHPATVLGVALLISTDLGARLIAGTEFGRAFVRSLG
jgi:hypothetical protein